MHTHEVDGSGYKCRDCNAVWDWQTDTWTEHQQEVQREKPCYRGNGWCPIDCCSHLSR